MSLMCPMEGCKQKQGMCIHEKMMMVVVLVAVIAGFAFWLK
jgi:Tfp pilus assembly protein FimT